jgi:hypothetical protein
MAKWVESSHFKSLNIGFALVITISLSHKIWCNFKKRRIWVILNLMLMLMHRMKDWRAPTTNFLFSMLNVLPGVMTYFSTSSFFPIKWIVSQNFVINNIFSFSPLIKGFYLKSKGPTGHGSRLLEQTAIDKLVSINEYRICVHLFVKSSLWLFWYRSVEMFEALYGLAWWRAE